MFLKCRRFTSLFVLSGLISPLAWATEASEASADIQQNPASMTQESEAAPEAIDDRFSTEGYVGVYGAVLQNTVPTLGLTGSLFLDEDFRVGLDFSLGRSKGLYGSFETQGAGVWGATEVADSLWLKTGLSFARIDRPSVQEPLSVLFKGEDESLEKLKLRSDSLGFDVALGQMWNFSRTTVSVDYLGFNLPLLRLTGPKLPVFTLHAARVEFLYNYE
ncbi:hypothetical protein EBU99_11870 [bacterium]|nr:hypothetical protein [bacterium]